MLGRSTLLSAVALLTACEGQIGGTLPSTSTNPSPSASPAPTLETCPAPAPGPARIVRLSAEEYRSTIAVLFGGRSLRLLELGPTPVQFTAPFSYARSSDRYSTYGGLAPVTEVDVDESWQAAALIAEAYVETIKERALRCFPPTGIDQSCLAPILSTIIERLWSRPAAPEELSGWLEEVGGSASELEPLEALRTLIRQLLLTPDFLFRTEIGGPGGLTPFERARGVAAALTQSPPDDALWRAAQSGALSSPQSVGAEVRRLLASPEELPTLRGFLNELLDFRATLGVIKDPTRFPKHKPGALAEDTQQVLDVLIKEHARSGLLREILSTDLIFVRSATKESWGVQAEVTAEGVYLRDPSRSGLLTHPAWLTGYSENDHNHIVRRGRFVRERLLCGSVPSLPIGMVPRIEQTAGTSYRQKLEQHSRDPSCWACHRSMDPLGFAFEAWDHLGRPQQMDNGAPVDTRGRLDSLGTADVDYANAKEMMGRLASAPAVQECWVRQLFRYYRGHEATAAEECEVKQLAKLYADSGEDTLAVIEALFVSPAYLERQGGAP